MPGRVGEDTPPVSARLVLRFGRTQLQQQGLRLVEVLDREVEVALLRHGLPGSPRSPVAIDALEADDEAVRAGDAGEVGVGTGVKLNSVASR